MLVYKFQKSFISIILTFTTKTHVFTYSCVTMITNECTDEVTTMRNQ